MLSPNMTDKKLKAQLNKIDLEVPNRNQFKKRVISHIKDLVEGFNYIPQIRGQIQIERFKEITKNSGEKTFLLKLLLSDDSTTIRVLIWGMSAVEYLKMINDGDVVVISNVAVKKNTYTNERELVFTKNSTIDNLR